MQQPHEYLRIIQANFCERQSNVGLHPKRLEKLEVINLDGVVNHGLCHCLVVTDKGIGWYDTAQDGALGWGTTLTATTLSSPGEGQRLSCDSLMGQGDVPHWPLLALFS